MEKVLNTSANKDDVIFFGYRDRETLKHGPLQRPIDEKTVADRAEDIKINGVINPILVKREGDGWFSIITGHHRWEAICRVWDTVDQDSRAAFNIQARGTFIKPEHVELVQIAENLIRNDLTKEERKVMAARYHSLILNQKDKDEQKDSQNRKKGETGWFADIYVKQLGKNEAYAMWDEFKVATGLSITPSKASVEQQQEFAAWHIAEEDRRKQVEEERKRLSDDAAKVEILKAATKAYETAQGVYLRACDVATKAGVPNVKYIYI